MTVINDALQTNGLKYNQWVVVYNYYIDMYIKCKIHIMKEQKLLLG